MRAALIACALGGCSVYASSQSPDARDGDAAPNGTPDAFVAQDPSCGQPLPTTAPPTIDLTGHVLKIATGNDGPAAYATVELVRPGGIVVASATTDANGEYGMSVPTGGAPIDAYLHVHYAGLKDLYLYRRVPYAGSELGRQLAVVDSDFYKALGGANQPGDPFLDVMVYDCAGRPLADATITVDPAGAATAVYINGDANGTKTGQQGQVVVEDVTPGIVRVDGEPNLHGHWVEAREDALTVVEMSP